jgi:hypothetical protein
MGARWKLNAGHLAGCLVLVALAGGVAGSWAVLAVAFAALAAFDLAAGNVRLRGR